MSTTPDDSSPLEPRHGHDSGEDRYPETGATGTATTDSIAHTRAAATWTGLVIGILVLILLLIFILQNLDSSTLHLFAWDFTLPLGVTILLAAIAGAVVMALAGGIRILQIRRAAKRGL